MCLGFVGCCVMVALQDACTCCWVRMGVGARLCGFCLLDVFV